MEANEAMKADRFQAAIDAINPSSTDEEWTRLLAEAMNAADDLSALRERVAALEDHIREQSDHVRTRIKDGDELGARVWRIALEDVLHENFTILAKQGGEDG